MLPIQTSSSTNDIDVLIKTLSWLKVGQKAAMATVIETWGSAPRPVGSQMAISENGDFCGSVSGGCVEGEVVTEALKCIRREKNNFLDFSISAEDARRAGLSCGGQLKIAITWVSASVEKIFFKITSNMSLLQACGLIINTSNGSCRPLTINEKAVKASDLANGRSGLIGSQNKSKSFLRAYAPGIKLLIIGAVHIAQPLTILGIYAGYKVLLIDPRDNWANNDRFPGITLDKRWPTDALKDQSPDSRTAIITLSHDPKLDDPALISALNSEAFYIGALGSHRTHQKRIERMKAEGFNKHQLKRIFAPIGLDIKAKSPFEIAISILGQIIEVNQRRLIDG